MSSPSLRHISSTPNDPSALRVTRIAPAPTSYAAEQYTTFPSTTGDAAVEMFQRNLYRHSSLPLVASSDTSPDLKKKSTCLTPSISASVGVACVMSSVSAFHATFPLLRSNASAV